MSWVKMEFYEDGTTKSFEMHCLLLSGSYTSNFNNNKEKVKDDEKNP
jgi:hypothetical protein